MEQVNYENVLTVNDEVISKTIATMQKASRRTLQEYRNDGILPYIETKGKCVYKESDIEKVLKRNYRRFVAP